MRIQAVLWLLGLLTVAALVTSCGSQQSSSESADEIIQADTANVDIAASNNDSTPTVIAEEPEQKQESKPPSDEPKPVEAAAEPTPVVEQPPEVQPSKPAPIQTAGEGEYVVKRGDTLMKIAFEIYGDIMQWNHIYDLNKGALVNPNQLAVGNKIRYAKPENTPSIERNGEPYKIKHGDTLGKIADDIYAKKSKWKKLWENNRQLIKDPNHIYAGFYLYYQITEEEKQEAERIRASKLGSSPTPPAESKPTPPPASNDGLSALSGGKENRAPASASNSNGSQPAAQQQSPTPAKK